MLFWQDVKMGSHVRVRILSGGMELGHSDSRQRNAKGIGSAVLLESKGRGGEGRGLNPKYQQRCLKISSLP